MDSRLTFELRMISKSLSIFFNVVDRSDDGFASFERWVIGCTVVGDVEVAAIAGVELLLELYKSMVMELRELGSLNSRLVSFASMTRNDLPSALTPGSSCFSRQLKTFSTSLFAGAELSK